MRIDINLERGVKQQRFLDYLNSSLGPMMNSSQGRARFHEDGTFESTLTGPVSIGHDQFVELSWRYTKSKDGELLYIEVEQIVSTGSDAWQDAASEVVKGAYESAYKDKRDQFFRRCLFNYIGPQLDGEYWFGQIRFAPILPDDDEPHAINAERVVCIDQTVAGIDELDAWALARQSSARIAARLSLLLDRGLYQPPQEQRWVVHGGEVKSIRAYLRFGGYAACPAALPAKGELCKPGQWGTSLGNVRRSIELLSLPKEARRVFRAIDHEAPPSVSEPFDKACRLYQVGAVLQNQFPSVSLAYRVAAVEALGKSEVPASGFSEFMRRNITSHPDIDIALNYLYGTVRSAHFHSGEFPLGEYDLFEVPRAFLSSEHTRNVQLRLRGFEITREAILNWLIGRIPAGS